MNIRSWLRIGRRCYYYYRYIFKANTVCVCLQLTIALLACFKRPLLLVFGVYWLVSFFFKALRTETRLAIRFETPTRNVVAPAMSPAPDESSTAIAATRGTLEPSCVAVACVASIEALVFTDDEIVTFGSDVVGMIEMRASVEDIL